MIAANRLKASSRTKTLDIVLIVIIGLLNVHIPHFFLEARTTAISGSNIIETIFLGNLFAALFAALGIYRDQGWGWILGIAVAIVSVVLYVLQETIGLPGLPMNWWEPSRIVALILEAVFIEIASYQLR